MADFSITVSNTINMLGEPASLWGDMVWGVDKWGAGSEDLQVAVNKLIDNSQSFSQDILNKQISHRIDDQDIPLTSDATVIGVRSGIWDYVYTLPTTNNDLAAHTSYTSSTVGTTSWTCAAAGSTTWS
jgi:hypothetical protein